MRPRFFRIGRLMSLTSVERADLFRAQWALIIASLDLRHRATGRWVRRPADGGRGAELCREAAYSGELSLVGEPRPPEEASRARAIDLAVRRAAAFGAVRTTCLLRATALQQLLEREGIRGSRLRVGVRRTGDRFDAHAWVEMSGLVLGDRPDHVSTFTSTDLELVRR